MKSREEFLEYFGLRPNDVIGEISANEIYDYFNPPQSEDKTWLDAKEPQSVEEIRRRNPIGRTFEINQLNVRQLQLDLEYLLNIDSQKSEVSEDVKERAIGFANRVIHLWRINNYTPNQTIDKRDWARLEEIISSEFEHALLSFNPSVEWPSEKEILNEIGKMSNPQRAVGFDLAINWLRSRIEKGLK